MVWYCCMVCCYMLNWLVVDVPVPNALSCETRSVLNENYGNNVTLAFKYLTSFYSLGRAAYILNKLKILTAAVLLLKSSFPIRSFPVNVCSHPFLLIVHPSLFPLPLLLSSIDYLTHAFLPQPFLINIDSSAPIILALP